MTQPDLSRVWNWLPAFLAIAEAGSAVAAARQLHLTPAAVSRTLRLLEDALQAPLFERVGRGLVLNEAGERLREATRRARFDLERGLADALVEPGRRGFAGPLRVASLGVLTRELVLPALLALKRAHSSIVPEHQNLGPAEGFAALARGELELVFHYEALDGEGRRSELLGRIPTAVYC
ncbi:MAG: LysR family transcriptional regulator, partial [Myxococcales bacterium]|nr:LysR family transcriptional regulator [Myxococcales bacterium]